jgi:hypothetical protein
MILEMPRHSRMLNLQTVLETAWERAGECNEMVVIMQKKSGGFIFYCPEDTKIETASFLAQQFLHHLHKDVAE